MTVDKYEKVMFGAGCFWGVESRFRELPGVIDAPCGYAGGSHPFPTYEQVCTGRTHHAEVVEVTYDPDQISFADLLAAFWAMHDPTTLNRQGPDIGTQYRSAIYTTTPEQKETAIASRAAEDASDRYRGPIVTEIKDAPDFYRAEDYHQRYFEKNGLVGCH